jgi:hypothetical protein
MKSKITFLLLAVCLHLSSINAQPCAGNCKRTITNGTGKLSVHHNDIICLQGTFNGEIEMLGGTIFICANANISQVTFKQTSKFICNSGIVRVQRINSQNSSKDIFVENHADSLVISQVNADGKIEIVNSGVCNISNINLNRDCNMTNTGRMNINGSLTLNANSKFTNNGVMSISGNVTNNNGQLFIQSGCQTSIGQSLLINQSNSIVRITEGQFTVGTINANNGKIELNNSSLLKVNSLTLSGYIEGIGSRSTVQCANAPNLNTPSSIRGNISLCVTGGAFNPNPGTITPPAAADCNNIVGSSPCVINPTGYEFFRLKNNANTWSNPSNWEEWINGQWQDATNGRYPKRTSVVLIDNNREMQLNEPVEIKKLILGSNSGWGKLSGSAGVDLAFTVTDSTVFHSGLSFIDVKNLSVMLKGISSDTVYIKGSNKGGLSIEEVSFKNKFIKFVDISSEGHSLERLSVSNCDLQYSDTLFIYKTLEPNNSIIRSNNKLVLVSNTSGTASVLKGTATNYLIGDVICQHYIPALARRFRFVSSPVTNTNLADWQNEIFITGNNAAGNATGNTPGTLNSAGFDASSNNTPTIYSYSEQVLGNKNNGWTPITNESQTLADVPLPLGRGYRMFVRGDRSDLGRLDGTNNTQNEVTLDLKGSVHTGNFTFPITFTSNSGQTDDGWNLLGNPYPAAFDWKTYYNNSKAYNSIEPNIWIYSPKCNCYLSYNALSNAGSLQNGIIPSGTSFWVKSKSSNASLTFEEDYKIHSSNNYSGILNARIEEDFIQLQLFKDSLSADYVLFKFMNGASKSLDSFDIEKYWSEIGIAAFDYSDSIYLDLSVRPIDYFKADVIPIYFYGDVSGQYKIRANSARSFSSSNTVYLIDNFTNTFVNLRTTPEYDFTIDKANPLTEKYDRFYLVYLPSLPDASQISYLFAEDEDTAGTYLEWATSSEPFPLTMKLQTGNTISNLNTIYTTASNGDPENGGRYGFYDTISSETSVRYYRIEMEDSVFGKRYSTIIKVDFITGIAEQVVSDWAIYPNPAHSVLNIQTPLTNNEPIMVEITDLLGKKVAQTFAVAQQGMTQVNINDIKAGVYLVRIIGMNSNESHTLRLIKE